MPGFSADVAVFSHSGSDFGSDSGEVTCINKYVQIQPLQLMSPKRETGVSPANVSNHRLLESMKKQNTSEIVKCNYTCCSASQKQWLR